MAMDMPPAQPEYRVERAAPAPSAMMKAVAVMRNEALTRSGALADHGTMERILPRIDVRSPALSQQDRNAMVQSMEAGRTEKLGQARISLPDSYVGQRLKFAIANARVNEARMQGDLDPGMVREARCRMVALALDGRAGAYVVGGEKAAADARAAVPREMVVRCQQAAQKARMVSISEKEGICTSPSDVSPKLTRVASVSISPTPSRRVSIDPDHSRRVSINPTPSKRVSIDPTPSKKTRLDLGTVAQAHAAHGRGV